MEKTTRECLLDAGLELLGTQGARGCTARAAEELAEVAHGSVRHHFASASGFYAALVEHLRLADQRRPGETPHHMVRRWLGPDRTITRARYELSLLALRDNDIRRLIRTGRDSYVAGLIAAGMRPGAAAGLVAAIDGLVLDAMIRERDDVAADVLEHLLTLAPTALVEPAQNPGAAPDQSPVVGRSPRTRN